MVWETTCCVQVRAPPDTVTVVAVLASADTIATSSDPAGGVNDAVVIVVVTNVKAVTGLLASSVMVPEGRISSSAQPPAVDGALAPTVVAPGVPVALVVLHDPQVPPLLLSTWLSTIVVPAAPVKFVPPTSASAP